MRVKHLTDLLTWDQIWTCQDVYRTNQVDSFSPVRVCLPGESSPEVGTSVNGKSIRASWYSPKARYSMQLLQTAENVVRQRTGWNPERVEWIPLTESFNTIRYLDFDPAEYAKIVMDEMQKIAGEGTLSIRSGWRSRGMDPHPGRKDEELLEFILPGYRRTGSSPRCEDLMKPNAIPKRDFSFRWEEIADAFAVLTPFQVAFFHENNIHRHAPIDDELIRACGQVDEAGVLAALEKGANIHALDEYGESVCSQLVGSLNLWWSESTDDAAHDPTKVKRILGILLDHGADIDLVGVGTETALCSSKICASWMMELLLRNGANPDEPSWIAPGEFPVTTLDEVVDEQSYCRMEEVDMDDVKVPDSYRMERLLYRYGAGDVVVRDENFKWVIESCDDGVPEVNERSLAGLEKPSRLLVRAAQRLNPRVISALMKTGVNPGVEDAFGRDLVRIAMEDSRIAEAKWLNEWPKAYYFDLTNFILFLVGYAHVPMSDSQFRWLSAFCRENDINELLEELTESPLFGERFRSAANGN